MKQKASSCFLALDCSLTEGSLTLMEIKDQELFCLAFKKWTSRRNKKRVENSHSERLPLEIQKALKRAGKKLSCLEFLAVGVGPGLWTGVRTAINVIRSLAFCLDIPVYAVNSLRLAGEPFLFPKEQTSPITQDSASSQTNPVFIAINGFKNKVHYAEFFSKKDQEGNVLLLPFEKWQKEMIKKAREFKQKKPVCVSNLDFFYPLSEELKQSFQFKKPCLSAWDLAKIVFRQKKQRVSVPWQMLRPFYQRSPVQNPNI